MLPPVHTHFGVLLAIHAMLSILLLGTLIRLGEGYLASSQSSTFRALGRAMAFQY